MIIGTTTANDSPYLVDNSDDQEGNSDEDCDTQSGDDEGSAQNDNSEQTEDHNFDEIFVAALDASRSGTVDAMHLSNIWRIKYEDVKRTLDISIHTTSESKIQSWHKTMEPTISCSDTRGSMNTFLWIPSSQQAKEVNPHVATPAANCS